MLYVAVRIEMNDMESTANAVTWGCDNSEGSPPPILAATKPHLIKAKVRNRIKAYPGERWIICFGQTIAEVSNDVSFRDA